jgi:hypothetical protein
LQQEAEARKAEERASKPTSDDKGGVLKVKAQFEEAERARKEKSKEKQEAWAAREAAIGERLKAACDKRERALPGMAKEAAILEVDVIKEEQRNFFDARAKEKLELEETRADAKRKFEADMAAQRSYNKMVKGESRKKFKEAINAATPMEVDVNGAGPSSLGATIALAARAHAPQLSDYYEEARLASLLDASIGMMAMLSD